ncbi:MAG: tRNA glutamyl-Q(34) synthetase GluQRS [Steroidobacteraceae bacterium]
MSASTATGTIGTAEPTQAAPSPYVGRFAPSPTGELHLGSLVAALGSRLEALRAGGQWLLRIEDLDTPRVLPGAESRILDQLGTLGFIHDGPLERQSAHGQRHAAALEQLRAGGHLFACACTRRQRALEQEDSGRCISDCAMRELPWSGNAVRYRMPTDPQLLCWNDRLQGMQRYDASRYRDVVVRRRDGIVAYQLAVVVDDAAAGVTDVVRGADLLDSTPWQRGLQHSLGLPSTTYAHLPLLLEADGAKLAKSRRSLPLQLAQPSATLGLGLALLRQEPPAGHVDWPVAELWDWAASHWEPARIAGLREWRLR